jgi:phosphoglycolate phosphatase
MTRRRPTVILFDVDGTLITSGGTGRKALVRSFERLYDRADACEHFSFAGMTDRAIFREGLRSIGAEGTEAEIDRLLEDYLANLAHEVDEAEVYAVHPGIVAALDALVDLSHVALGLGTGNVEQGARIKIARVDLNSYFDFGGFGCDAEPRAELIAAGARRGAERLGVPLSDCRLLIVGDTPKDVAAAHDNGGVCIAVATGGASYEALIEAGGDLVCHDLTDPRALGALTWDGISAGPDALASAGGER